MLGDTGLYESNEVPVRSSLARTQSNKTGVLIRRGDADTEAHRGKAT